jgi:hypothetical protein
MYPRLTPQEWARQNPYAYARGISPPRNRHEEPRQGYYTHEYRSVSPLNSSMGLRRRPRVNSAQRPRLQHADMAERYGYRGRGRGWNVNNVPGGQWYGGRW